VVFTVLERYLEAQGDGARATAFRYLIALPQLILRCKRGGRINVRQIKQRMEWFLREQYSEVISHWEKDLASNRSDVLNLNGKNNSVQIKEPNLAYVLKLLAGNKISKAGRIICSNGSLDASLGIVQDKLRTKFPQSRNPIQPAFDGSFASYSGEEVKINGLFETFRTLKKMSGSGPDAWTNEMLTCLCGDSPASKSAIDAFEEFLKIYANGSCPSFVYNTLTCTNLIAISKEEAPSGGAQRGHVPDVRPIGAGNVIRRTLAIHQMRECRGACAEYFAPIQMAIGVSDGSGVLVHWLRETYELNRGVAHQVHGPWTMIKMDLKNAFNSMSRASFLNAIDGLPEGINHLTKVMFAEYNFTGKTASLGKLLDILKQEGADQGDPRAMLACCAVLHKHLDGIDEFLGNAAPGAGVKAYADDCYICAPAALAYKALNSFASEAIEDGCEISFQKCSEFCLEHDTTDEVELNRRYPMRNQELKLGKLDGKLGIMCQGIPIGEDEFISKKIDMTYQKAESDLEKIFTTLRLNSYAMFTMISKSSSKKANHFLRYCFPRHTKDFARKIDSLINKFLSLTLEMPIPTFCDHEKMDEQELAVFRMRHFLPSSKSGSGISSATNSRLKAFLGAAMDIMPRLCGTWVNETGELVPGFSDALTTKIKFCEIGGHAWSGLFDETGGAKTPLAEEMKSAFEALKEECTTLVQGCGSQDDDDGVASRMGEFSKDFVDFRLKLPHHSQQQITELMTGMEVKKLRAYVNSLEAHGHTRMCFQDVARCKVASSFLNAWPDHDHNFRNREFQVIYAHHFCLPQPILSQFVGNRIGAYGRESNILLDKNGYNLYRAGARGFPGMEIGDWRRVHDIFVRTMNRVIRSCGQVHTTLEPLGLFDHCVVGRTCADKPDILARGGFFPETGAIMDMKTIYPNQQAAIATEEEVSFSKVLEKRQEKVNKDYVKRAHNHDIVSGYAVSGSQIPDPGSENVNGCLRKLRDFGRVLGPVISSFCAVSSDCDLILRKVARLKAEAIYEDMNFQSPGQALSHILFWHRRHLSAVMHKAFARLLIARVRWVTPASHAIVGVLANQADSAIYGVEGIDGMLNAQRYLVEQTHAAQGYEEQALGVSSSSPGEALGHQELGGRSAEVAEGEGELSSTGGGVPIISSSVRAEDASSPEFT
jgi:hypothetical protein